MTDEPRPGDVFEIDPSQSEGLLKRLPWWLIGAFAALVAELTAHPSIGVVVLCLKFGWNDFQTALWLRRRDPIPLRGRICFWFYAASSLWRICISGFALMFVLAVILGVSAARQAPAGGRPQVAVQIRLVGAVGQPVGACVRPIEEALGEGPLERHVRATGVQV